MINKKFYFILALKKSNRSFEALEVELAYSKAYFNVNSNIHAVLIYYIVAIDGLVKYESELPSSWSDLDQSLTKIGFKTVSKESLCRVRSILIDTNERPAEFNHDLLSLILEQSWTEHIKKNGFILLPTNSLRINVKVIKQSLYYVNE